MESWGIPPTKQTVWSLGATVLTPLVVSSLTIVPYATSPAEVTYGTSLHVQVVGADLDVEALVAQTLQIRATTYL